jgi:hypothetical protein
VVLTGVSTLSLRSPSLASSRSASFSCFVALAFSLSSRVVTRRSCGHLAYGVSENEGRRGRGTYLGRREVWGGRTGDWWVVVVMAGGKQATWEWLAGRFQIWAEPGRRVPRVRHIYLSSLNFQAVVAQLA